MGVLKLQKIRIPKKFSSPNPTSTKFLEKRYVEVEELDEKRNDTSVSKKKNYKMELEPTE